MKTNGKEMEKKILKTTGNPTKIRLTADRSEIKADRNDLAYVTVEVIDENGNLVPNTDLSIQFKVEGSGELAAVENGNPTDMKSFSKAQVNSYRGKCLVILRSSGKVGEIRLKAEPDRLEGSELVINAK